MVHGTADDGITDDGTPPPGSTGTGTKLRR